VCLVVVAFAVQPEYPLVVAANRDEFHARPTQNADWWPDQPDIVAGRDLQAGGTWLGLHRAGRFATITNFRDANSSGVRLRSRGHHLSNRGGSVRELPPGVYGLSNATLDTPWEKVERSKSRLGEILANGDANDTQLFRLLDDREKGPVSEVKSDRLPFETAHAITAPFIVTPEYGTRCSSIVRADKGGRWQLLERRFNSAGKNTGEAQFSFHSGEDRQ
jgi:uncharacterized protein with NRDE domain